MAWVSYACVKGGNTNNSCATEIFGNIKTGMYKYKTCSFFLQDIFVLSVIM